MNSNIHDYLQDRAKLRVYLNDRFPRYLAKVNVMLLAVDERIVENIQNYARIDRAWISQQRNILISSYGLLEDVVDRALF